MDNTIIEKLSNIIINDSRRNTCTGVYSIDEYYLRKISGTDISENDIEQIMESLNNYIATLYPCTKTFSRPLNEECNGFNVYLDPEYCPNLGTDDYFYENIYDQFIMYFVNEISVWCVSYCCENTTSGNYIIKYEEIAKRFGIDLANEGNKDILDMVKDSIQEDYKVASEVWIDDEGIDINLYLDYCPNYESWEFEL